MPYQRTMMTDVYGRPIPDGVAYVTRPSRRGRPQAAHPFEGYGVYEFSGPFGDLPPGVTLQDIIKNMDAYIDSSSGIQVAKPEVKPEIMTTLNSMSFVADDDEVDGPTITGQANFIVFSLGDAWATEYLKDGYAILIDKASVSSGQPKVVLTQIAGVILDHAYVGGPFAVVDAPPALLAQAQQLAHQPPTGPVPPPVPGSTGPGPTLPGPTVPPGPMIPTQPSQPAGTSASDKIPSWVIPTMAGVGVVALIAAAVALGKK